jgi:hypothetical protein
MYQVIKKQIRPTTDVSFFLGEEHTSPEVKQYLYTTYAQVGKQLMINRNLSDDGLTLSTTQIWLSREDYLECQNDSVSVAMKVEFDAYIESNNIIFEVVESEV